MRRFVVAGIAVAFVLAVLGLARAQVDPPCSFEYICSTYLSIVMTTAPTPPPIETTVLDTWDMPGFTLDQSHEITNTVSAQSYLDPPAALLAFAQQGRETSWYVRYLSRTRPLGVSDQAIRYFGPEGADAGVDYAVADERAAFPHYGDLVSVPIGDRAVGCLALSTSNGTMYAKYFYAIRKGRMVALVQVVAPANRITGGDAWEYVQKAVTHLP